MLFAPVRRGAGGSTARSTATSSGSRSSDHLRRRHDTKTKHDIDGKDQNILVVGNDDRSTATDAELAALGTGRDGGSLNTDTMMIIHVPANGSKATLISLPRDSWVNIPGYGYSKLNSAYPDGYNAAGGTPSAKRAAGAKLLVETIQNLTGLTIDHFVSVDLLGFYRISNAIGGITVNMCGAVQDSYLRHQPAQGRQRHQGHPGARVRAAAHNVLNALGDLDRVQRQQYFLTAAFRKVTTAGVLLNPFKLQHLLNAVSKSLYMDSVAGPAGAGPADGEPDREQHRRQDDPDRRFGTRSATVRASSWWTRRRCRRSSTR